MKTILSTETPKQNHIVNMNLQELHVDSCVLLTDEFRARYGGAKFIDAETFVRNHPLVTLQNTFTLGFYGIHPVQSDFGRIDCETCFRINGWE